MPSLHRNSQKRIYRARARYFVTSVTFDRYPYFKNTVLVELFVRNLWFARELKKFELFGYTVMPDHVHLLFQPRGEFNYSQIMHNIKRVFALQANQIMFSAPPDELTSSQLSIAGDDIYRRLQWTDALSDLHKRFLEQHPKERQMPAFHWQSSFRDHIIRGENDFHNHVHYIYNNASKHGVASESGGYPYMWIQGMTPPFQAD